ncbi:MAG: hypothetical protein ACREI1_01650 [Nitrospiraceae bacterium]
MESHQIGEEKKQAATARRKGPWCQRELPHIGNRFDGRARVIRPFFVQTPRQRRKALGSEQLSNRRGTQGAMALLKSLANLVNRIVLLAQADDQIARGRFLGLRLRSTARGDKKDWIQVSAEVMAEHVKGIEGVAEGACDLFGRPTLQKVSPQGLVLALFGTIGLGEESAAFT